MGFFGFLLACLTIGIALMTVSGMVKSSAEKCDDYLWEAKNRQLSWTVIPRSFVTLLPLSLIGITCLIVALGGAYWLVDFGFDLPGNGTAVFSLLAPGARGFVRALIVGHLLLWVLLSAVLVSTSVAAAPKN